MIVVAFEHLIAVEGSPFMVAENRSFCFSAATSFFAVQICQLYEYFGSFTISSGCTLEKNLLQI